MTGVMTKEPLAELYLCDRRRAIPTVVDKVEKCFIITLYGKQLRVRESDLPTFAQQVADSLSHFKSAQDQ
jgi:hypothetical protein